VKYGYKQLIVFGEICCVIGGLLPFWIRSFPIILFSRLIMGAGTGLSGTAATGLIYSAYDDVRLEAKVQAILQAAGYAGALAFTILGGWLSDIQWNYCFLAYILVIPAAVISVLYTPPVIKEIKEKKIPIIVPIEKTAWGIMIILALMSGFAAIFSNNISGYTISNGFGSALTAGISQGFLDVAGFLGCLFGYAIYLKTDRWIIALCSFLCGVTYFIFAGTASFAAVCIAATAFGFLVSIKAPLTATMISEIQPSSTMTSVCGISSLIDQLCSTVIVLSFTKIFTDGTSGNERTQFLAGGVGFVIAAVIALIFTLKYKRPGIEDMPG